MESAIQDQTSKPKKDRREYYKAYKGANKERIAAREKAKREAYKEAHKEEIQAKAEAHEAERIKVKEAKKAYLLEHKAEFEAKARAEAIACRAAWNEKIHTKTRHLKTTPEQELRIQKRRDRREAAEAAYRSFQIPT